MVHLHLGLVVLLCGVSTTFGVQIINCGSNNKVEIFEDSPAPVTCGDITSTADVVWRRGDGVNIGECGADGLCNTDFQTDYKLSRSAQSRESQLTLVPDYRRHAGVTVTCHDRASLSTATCTLVIKRHSVLSECHVTTNPVDWTVSGSCRVQQAFSSDNNYSCSWRLNDELPTFGGFDNNRERCSFTNQLLPHQDGLDNYTIIVIPPPTAAFSNTLRKGRASSPESSVSIKWIIAVVVTAVILLVILITAISIKRLKLRCRDPVYETTVAPAGDVHTYTGLQAGDSIDTVSKTLHHRSEGVVAVMVYENQGQEVPVYQDDSDIYYNSV